ncbi:MAG: MoaD family protein [Syntrophothermus sp.]|uniref:MoaD family protein n=1 Tax=Syntrophothermus sp. TaxID=2736299 RepID=UPI00257FB7AD|nr:MoaD family protein [Syntrophothermus sp.]NSW82890.1 MoaD family protein [Syntrophothermus sp.]
MKVLFFATLRKVTGCTETEVHGPADLEGVLRELGARYGSAFREKVFPDGQLSRDVMVMINGHAVEHLGGSKAVVNEDDTIAIFPRLAGG